MHSTILPVEAIRERDVDLILLEELTTDADFCLWFTQELGVPEFHSLNGAWRSITDYGLGETDLLFSYNSNGKKIFILIENKLDAIFQEEQFARYEKRGLEYKTEDKCQEAYSVLIAPELYCTNQNDFENFISYENIISRFELSATKRSLFKSELLKIAIEKLRRGYQPVNSEPVQNFWLKYWYYKEKHYPDFKMKKPGVVPHNSDWPMLFDDRLSNIVFYHKLRQGNVDVTFRNYSDNLLEKLKEKLPGWAKIQKHQKTFSIRIFSGKIDRTTNFDKQLDHVENGLHNLNKIRNWLIEQEILAEHS